MAGPDDSGWTDEDFIPQSEPHVLDQQREEIRQKLAAGIPREQVEDELIRDGCSAEYAVKLVDSVRRSMPAEAIPPAPREAVSEELNFDDGTVRCQRCGCTIPEEEARGLLRIEYREDDTGPAEYSRRRLIVCSGCARRTLRWQWFRDLRDRLGLGIMLAFALGIVALFAYVLLAGLAGW